MLSRLLMVAIVAFGSTTGLAAEPPASLDQRIVAVIARPAPADDMRSALTRLRREAGPEQLVTIDSFESLIDGYSKSDVKALADAEAFAAAHPRSGGALISLAYAQLRSEQTEQGADSLIAGVAVEPGLADALSSANASRLVSRLRFNQDHDRIRGLAKSLFDAGWTRGTIDDRSFLATQLILVEIGQGREARAKQLLSFVSDPQRLYAMLVDNRFAPLRAEIERTAGKRLELRWRDYLVETRDAWTESGDEEDALAFVRALQRAEMHHALVDQFLFRFARGYNCPNDPVARALAPYLVNSLAALGQLGKAETVLSRTAGANGRVDANMLSYIYLTKGRYPEAASLIDRMIESMAKAKTPVDQRQMVLIRARLACANAKRGIDSGSVVSDGLGLTARLWVARCLDHPAETKQLLLAALDREQDRLEALTWLQPDAELPNQSPFELALRAAKDRARTDPDIIAAVGRYGKSLDWPLTVDVPVDLAPARPKRPPPCGTLRTEPEKPDSPEDLYERRRQM